MGWSIGRIAAAVSTGGLSEVARAGKNALSGLSGGSSSSSDSGLTSQADILKDQWNFYTNTYLPAEKELAKWATAEVPTDLQQKEISRDLSKSYAKQSAIATREAQRYGGTGQTSEGVDRTNSMIRKAAEIGARNQAKGAAADTELSRLSAVAQIGQGLPSTALSGYNAYSGMQSSLAAQQNAAKSSLVNGGLGILGGVTGALGGGTTSPTVWGSTKSLYKSLMNSNGNTSGL